MSLLNIFSPSFADEWKIFDPISDEISFPLRSLNTSLRPQSEVMKPLSPLMIADFTESDTDFTIHGT